MLPAARVPPLGGKGASFLNLEQKAQLWRQVTNRDPAKRASALISRIDTAARNVCMAAGNDATMDGDDAEQILAIPQDSFAPDRAGSVYQEVIRFYILRVCL